MSHRFGGLWGHRDFLKLWYGQTVSMFGSMAGCLALSLVAVITFKATPPEVAVLNGCGLVPELAFGLIAGVVVDRLPRRSILIAADLGRAVVMAWIPLASVLHVLTIVHLYLVAALISALTVFFEVAYVSYIPELVGRDALVEGNSKLEASAAVAEAGGFGVGGILVQLLTAPVAVAVDALSFAVSAISLFSIPSGRSGSTATEGRSFQNARQERGGVWREVREGLLIVANNPVQRAIAAASVTEGLFGNMIGVVIMLFFVRDLHLTPGSMGPLFALGGVAAFGGAMAAPRLAARIGTGRTLILSVMADGVGTLCIAIASGPFLLVLALLAAEQIIGDSSATIYSINQVTLLQGSTPNSLQGRVNATIRFLSTGAMLMGLALGGWLGDTIGLRETLFVAAAGKFLVPLWYVFSPVRTLRRQWVATMPV